MSTNPAPDKPFRFTSETLNSLVVIVLIAVILVPCVWVVVRAVKDVRHGLRERRTWKKTGRLKGGGINDPENQRWPQTDLELDREEMNGGLCELEQPGLPELSAIGIVEMWDEGCAKEICGKIVAVELDADKQTTPTSKVSNLLSTDAKYDEKSPDQSVYGNDAKSGVSGTSSSVAN